MKKLKTAKHYDALLLIFTALLTFFCVYATFPHMQYLATLPVLLTAGLVLPLFYKRAAVLIPITALSAILLALALTEGYDAHIFYAFVPTLFYTAAYFVTRLAAFLAKRDKAALGKALSFIGALLLFGIWFLVMGNPVSLRLAETEAKERYAARYPEESFVLTERFYDPLVRDYKTTHKISSGKSFTATAAEDGYLTLMQNRAAELQKSALLALLHEKFPADGNYLITLQCPTLNPEEVSAYKYGDMPEKWLAQNDILLEFDSSFAVGSREAKAAFAARVRDYVKYLNETQFPYASVTFRGGEQDTPLYELTATKNTSLSELIGPNVRDLKE